MEGVIDANTHLEGYKIRESSTTPEFTKVENVRIVTQCNDLPIEVRMPVSLLVPTNKDLNTPVAPPVAGSHDVDHFLCYRARAERRTLSGVQLPRFPRGVQVDVTDQFQTRRYDLLRIEKLCAPVAKSGSPLFLAGPDEGTPKVIGSSTIGNPGTHTCIAPVRHAS
jgi:hypothetical protein